MKKPKSIMALKHKLIIIMGGLLFIAVMILSIISMSMSSSIIRKETLELQKSNVEGVSKALQYKIQASVNELGIYAENTELVELLTSDYNESSNNKARINELTNSLNKRFLDDEKKMKIY